MNFLGSIVIDRVIKSTKVDVRDGLGDFFEKHLKAASHVRVRLENVGLKSISRMNADLIERAFSRLCS